MDRSFLPGDSGVKTTGRTLIKDGKIRLTWVGTSFSFSVKGTERVLLSLDRLGEDVERYIKITADKREQVHAVSVGTDNVVVLLDGDGAHDITVRRITEGTTDIVVSNITLYGSAPEMVAAGRAEKKKIEFIGDSLTAGYGNLGSAATPVYHSYEQDCTKAFSCLTASMLDLEYSLVAVSGKGLSHNWDGSTDFLIPEFYGYASRETKEKWDFEKWVPDIIVINAGSNDETSRTPGDVVYEAAGRFVRTVRDRNPGAVIIYAYGFTDKKMADPLYKAASELMKTDGKLYFHRFGDVYGKPDEKGANGHPNVRSHMLAAKELCDFMISKGIV